MEQWVDLDPGIRAWQSPRSSAASPERSSRPQGLEMPIEANDPDSVHQQSSSPTDINTETTDHFYPPPQRSKTTPISLHRKAASPIKYETNGHTFRSQKRQSTKDTKYSATFKETAPWDRKAILSLDGGGIRGYSALLIIKELMRVIKRLETEHPGGRAESSYHPLPWNPVYTTDSRTPDHTDLDNQESESSQWLPCHYFDYMAGTSTGGLISIMLGRLRMNIEDCISDYEMLGGKVFGHGRWFHVRSLLWLPRDKYDHKKLEDVVKDVVARRVPKVPQFPGGQNFAFDENRCRVVVVAYQQPDEDDERQRERVTEDPYLFRTYKNLHQSEKEAERLMDRNPGPAHDIPIWQVARATSAAPTYFKAAEIDNLKYLDGGFGANNPCQEIFEEVLIMNNRSEQCVGVIVSIGTGKNKGLKVSRFGGLKEKKNRWQNQFGGASGLGLSRYINFVNFAGKWATQSEQSHQWMTKRVKDTSFQYHRLNVEEGIGLMKLDEWRIRGLIRTKIGSHIGKLRQFFAGHTKKADQEDHIHDTSAQNGEAVTSEKKESAASDASAQNGEAVTSEKKESAASDASAIPRWFRPRNQTLESLREHTEAYLRKPDVQEMIEAIAQVLVDGRRERAESDPDRWLKACFGAWYQCKMPGCPRGEKEYHDRHAMEKHLLHKHNTSFPTENDPTLESTLDDFRIVVH